MKRTNPLICFLLACIVQMGFAQVTSKDEMKIIHTLLDSAEAYKLKSPERNLQFASSLLERASVKENDTIHVKALLYAANSLKMLSRKEESLRHASEAIEISNRISNHLLIIRSHYMKASIFGQYDDQDSSLIYYQKVIDLHRPGIDLYYISSSYTSIGHVYSTLGNDQKAEEYLLKGYELTRGDEYSKLFSLSPLISFYVSRDNPKYLPYLDTLAKSDFYTKASPASFMAHFESFLLLDEADDATKEKKLREVYAYSFDHSSLVNQVGYGFKLVNHLMDLHRHEEAGALLLELYQKAVESKNEIYISRVARNLYQNSKSMGNSHEALKWLEIHSQLRDSLLSDENSDRISELNIRFETAQKDHEIEQQKIRLEQERRNRNFFILLALLLTTLAAVIFFYFRNRARSAHRIAAQEKVIHQQETEKLLKEKELSELSATLDSQEKERNRIARDLHDGLGSMMSGISAQIEHLRGQPAVEKSAQPHLSQLREMVNEATSELRRTSYELMPAKLLRQGLEPAIRDLCLNLLVKNGLEPSLEINADLTKLNHEQQLTLYRIVQELLNNIVKHAHAKNVLIQFNNYEHEISLIVEDDGQGFDVASKKMHGGLGLGSLQTRVDLLKGFLDIASTPGEGTTVTVNFNEIF